MSSLPSSSDTGWSRLRAVLDRDLALPAVEKALIVALVAADRGRDALVGAEVDRLRDLGGEKLVDGAIALLTLARGRAVADRFAVAAGREPGSDSAAPDPDPAETEAARVFFVAPDGSTPPAIALLAAHAPGYLVGYRELREGLYAESGIGTQLAELALFAVSAGDYVEPHAAVHAGKAVAAGATGAQLVEAGLCAVPAAGMAAWLVAAGAIASVLSDDAAVSDPAVERLVAEAEIRDVIARYCRGVDDRDYDRVRDCYHPDARHERGEFAGSGTEIVDWIAGIRDTLIHCWHLVGYPRIESLEGDRAEVETYTLANQRLPGRDGGPPVDRLTPCRYLDTFTRVEGRWRIAHRRALYLPAQELPVSPAVESPDSFSGAG